MPQMLRFPKFVRPASMSPVDVLRAAGQTEKVVVNQLITQPLAALGIKLAPPSLGEKAAGLVSRISGLSPGKTREEEQSTAMSGGHNPWPGRRITIVDEKDLVATGVGPPATPPSIRYHK